jgi:DNA polymerase III subunit chi
VKDNSAKIHLICTKAQEAFKQEKRLLIAVPNFQAAQYVEALLWKVPAESFMPHVVSDTPTSEWIAITMQEQHNVNQAVRLLNLCPTPSPLYQHQHIAEVYELYDETHPQKAELSQQRLQLYQSKGLLVKIEGSLS